MFLFHIKFKKLLYNFIVVICFFSEIQAVPDTVGIQEVEKQKQDIHEKKSPALSSLSFFQERNIDLPAGSGNIISLNFEDLPQGMSITNYQLDGKTIGRLTTTDSMVHFKAHDVQPYNFLLTSPVRTNIFIVETQGKFTFQKAIESQIAALTCKSVTFRDTFESKQDLIVQANSYNNYSRISCLNLKFDGKSFYVAPKASLDVQGKVDILGVESFVNQGKIFFGQSTVIVTDSLENYGDLRVGLFNLTAKKFMNKGFVDILDSFLGTCNSIENQGRWNIVNNCVLQQVGQFKTSHGSQWNVGNNLIAHVDKLFLEGRSSVGNLALLRIGSYAQLSGPFRAHIFDLESNGLITSTPQARFFVKHHFGLKAQGWIGYEGDVIEKALIQDDVEPSLSQANPLDLQYSKGVFLESQQSGIKKSGDIIATSGKVSLVGNKFVKDSGITDAGSNSDAMIFMHAQNVILEKEALLRSSFAQLTAQDLIEQHGKTLMGQQLDFTAPRVVHTGTSSAYDFVNVQANDFSSQAASQIHSENVILNVENSIDQSGDIHTQNFSARSESMRNSGMINAQSGNIIVGKCIAELTSVMNIKHFNIKAKNSIDQNGKINSDNLSMRANFVNNSGEIHSLNADINANRWWWNTGNVVIENNLNINALASINSLNWERFKDFKTSSFGMMRAKNLTINSVLNLNVGGMHQAQNANINSLIDLNVGLYVPQLNSLDDIFTEKNFKQIIKTLFMTNVPAPARLACQAAMTIWSLPELYKNAETSIKNAQDLYKQEGSEISDWMPVVCGIKNSVVSVVQVALTAQEVSGAVFPTTQIASITKTATKNESSQAPSVETKPATNIQSTIGDMWKCGIDVYEANSEYLAPVFCAAKVIGACGPHLNRTSLLDINAGAVLGVNGHSMSVWNVNAGLSAFSNSNIVDTCYGKNYGVFAASHLNIHATNDYSSTGSCYGLTGSITADNLDVSQIRMIDRLSLQATKNARLGKDIYASNTYIKAESLNNQGTIHGALTVDVVNQSHIGNVDCQGKAFTYLGPVTEDFADKLVLGKGDDIQISNQSSTNILAGDQDIHLKQQHDLTHSVYIKTKGNIDADKKIAAKGSIIFDAKGDVTHKSLKATGDIGIVGDNVTAKSTVQRVAEGDNYNDTLDQVSIQAGGKIGVHADMDVNHAAVHTKSGAQGTQITANRDVIDGAVSLQSHTKNHTESHIKKENIQTDTQTTSINMAVSRHESQGDYIAHANGKYIGIAPQFATKGVSTTGEQGTTFLQAHNATSSVSDYKKDGGRWFKHSDAKQVESQSLSSFGAHFDTKEKPIISAPQGAVTLQGISGTAPIVQSRDPVTILLNKTVNDTFFHRASSNVLYNSEKIRERSDHEYRPLQTNGKMEVDSPIVNVEVVKGQIFDVLEKISMHGEGVINQTFVENMYFRHHESTASLTPESTIVLALAISAATAGIASSGGAGLVIATGIKSAIVGEIVSSMTAATITSLSVQIAKELAECQGDFAAAAKNIASTDTLKQAAISAVTAGMIIGSNQILDKFGLPDVKKADSFLKRIGYVAPRQAARVALLTSIAALSGGQDIQAAAMQNLREAAAGTIGIACVSQIGHDYAQGNMHPVIHKSLHTVTGAVTGAIVGGKNGAIAGGTGALIAETVADVFAPKGLTLESVYQLENEIGRKLTQEEFHQHWGQQTENYMRSVSRVEIAAKMTAVTAALIARQDMSTANFTANTAVDNNFLVLALYGVTAASTAYSVYNIYNAYEEGGPIDALKQLGVEVVYDVAGHVVGRVIGNAVYKFGGVVYPTAKAAVNAALDQAPGLKVALGSFTNKMIIAGEKYGETVLAKGIARVEQNILKAEAKVFNNAVQAKDKILQQVGLNGHAQSSSILVSQKPSVQALVSAQERVEAEWVLAEKARPASSYVHKGHLDNKLNAQHIANGHAFDKHVIERNEFSGIATTKIELGQHLENVVADPATLYREAECLRHKTLHGCPKKIFYQESSNTLVINDPHSIDKGTAYQPIKKIQEFYDIK